MNTMIFVVCLLGWQSWDTPAGTVSVCSDLDGVRVRVVSKDVQTEFSATVVVKRGAAHISGRSTTVLDMGGCRIVMPSFFASVPVRWADRMNIPIAAVAGLRMCRMSEGVSVRVWLIDLSGTWAERRPDNDG